MFVQITFHFQQLRGFSLNLYRLPVNINTELWNGWSKQLWISLFIISSSRMYCVIFRLLHKCLCACPCVAWLIGWVNCSIIAGRFVLKCSMNSKLVRLQTCSESSTVKRNQVCTNSPILHTRAILLLLCILVLPAQSPVFKFVWVSSGVSEFWQP